MPIGSVWGAPTEDHRAKQPLEEYVEKMKDNVEYAYELARKKLQVAADKRKATYDVRVKTCKFAPGDWVWYCYRRRYHNRSPKWRKFYTRPYLVVRAIPPVNFVLQMSAIG